MRYAKLVQHCCERLQELIEGLYGDDSCNGQVREKLDLSGHGLEQGDRYGLEARTHNRVSRHACLSKNAWKPFQKSSSTCFPSDGLPGAASATGRSCKRRSSAA